MLYRDLVIACLLLLSGGCVAQDTLYYVNGNTVIGQVIAIEMDHVRYTMRSGNNTVEVSSAKEELEKIKLQNGQEFYFDKVSSTAKIKENSPNRKNGISFDVVAPFLNHIVLGYERSITANLSLQVKLGYIGIFGNSIKTISGIEGSKGVMGKFGAKIFLPRSGSKNGHSLSGFYLKPELMASSWSQTYLYRGANHSEYYRTEQYLSGAFHICMGYQAQIGQHVLFDVFGGLGLGTESSNSYSSTTQRYAYSHAFLLQSEPLAFSGGLMFGFVF